MTQEWLELGVFAHLSRASTERQACFALTETERAQGSERSELPVRSVWCQRAAVSRSIGVAKLKRARRAAFDAQSPAMTGAMMSAAQREQVLWPVSSAVFASLNVVHIDERRVPASGYLATVLVPPQHGAPHRRRNHLGCFENTRSFTHMGAAGLTRVGAGGLTRVGAR